MGTKRPRFKRGEPNLPLPVVSILIDDEVNYDRNEWWEYGGDVTMEFGPRIKWTKMPDTQISDEKRDAYMFADYIVFVGSSRFTMKVNEYSPDLKSLLHETNQIWGAFLTAYNPHGKIRDKDTNQAANARLREHLDALGALVFEGEGADPTGEWSPEPSFFVLGIDIKAARQIGEQYRQDAIIWIEEDAIPELVLLR